MQHNKIELLKYRVAVLLIVSFDRGPEANNYSTVQKKCKGNSVFFVLCSRENSTKFCNEISSKRSRIFVESNEISLSSWRNFGSTEAKFALAKFRQGENSQLQKFPQSEILLAVEEGCNENLLFAPL